jgi:hypothetical protein
MRLSAFNSNTCPECHLIFSGPWSVGVHRQHKHGIKDALKGVPFPVSSKVATVKRCSCDECGRTFGSENGLSVHKARSHRPSKTAVVNNIPVKSNEVAPIYSINYCPSCGFHIAQLVGADQ